MSAYKSDATQTASKVVPEGTGKKLCVIKNMGPDTVYLSNSAAPTVAQSFPLLIGESLVLAHDGPHGLELSEALYGICDTGDTAELRVLEL